MNDTTGIIFIIHIHFIIPKKLMHKKTRDFLLESSCVNALMNYILQKWCLYCSRPKNCVTISPHSAKKGRKRRNTHTQSHNKGPCNTHTQYRRIGLFGQHYCIKKLKKTWNWTAAKIGKNHFNGGQVILKTHHISTVCWHISESNCSR